MTNYLTLRIEAVHARSQFGIMLRAWYRINCWQVWTLASWAESAGFHAIPYGLIPELFHGTAGELTREDFEGLGEANRRLAERDYGTFANLPTLEAVRDSIAIQHASGVAWTASDFWACYCGLLQPVSLENHQ